MYNLKEIQEYYKLMRNGIHFITPNFRTQKSHKKLQVSLLNCAVFMTNQ